MLGQIQCVWKVVAPSLITEVIISKMATAKRAYNSAYLNYITTAPIVSQSETKAADLYMSLWYFFSLPLDFVCLNL